MIFASSIAVLFGAYEQTEGAHFVLSLPELAFEASIAIYLIVKGFKASPILDETHYADLRTPVSTASLELGAGGR
jgi:hypothetical protein